MGDRFRAYVDTLEVQESSGFGSETVRVSYIVDTETSERTDDPFFIPKDYVRLFTARHRTGIGIEEAWVQHIVDELNGYVEDDDDQGIATRKAALGFVPIDEFSYPSPVIGTRALGGHDGR